MHAPAQIARSSLPAQGHAPTQNYERITADLGVPCRHVGGTSVSPIGHALHRYLACGWLPLFEGQPLDPSVRSHPVPTTPTS